MRRSKGLSPGQKALARGSSFANPRSQLAAVSPRRAEREAAATRRPRRSTLKATRFTPPSPAQRAKVDGLYCLLAETGECQGPIDPAHTIPRSMGGDDDPRCVVPLCRYHHGLYDDLKLSILEYLEPNMLEEQAYAAGLVGTIASLQRLTNQAWAPVTYLVRDSS